MPDMRLLGRSMTAEARHAEGAIGQDADSEHFSARQTDPIAAAATLPFSGKTMYARAPMILHA